MWAGWFAFLTIVAGFTAVAVRFRQLGDPLFFWGVVGAALISGGVALNQSWTATRTIHYGESFLRAILDSIPASVSWVSRDLTYLGANRVLSDWLEVPEDGIIGRPLGFLSREEGKALQDLVERSFRGNSQITQAEILLRKHGKVVPCLVTVQMLASGKEAVVIAVEMARAI